MRGGYWSEGLEKSSGEWRVPFEAQGKRVARRKAAAVRTWVRGIHPRVFCSKSLDLLEKRRDRIFGAAKEFGIV